MLRCLNEIVSLTLMVLITLTFCLYSTSATVIRVKKSASSDDNMMDHAESNLDRLNINYDEYPMIVPKRAAILLDRIMVALHHALEDNDQEGVRRINDLYRETNSRHPKNIKLPKDFHAKYVPSFNGTHTFVAYQHRDDNTDLSDEISGYLDVRDLNSQRNILTDEMMGLQRRGHGEQLGISKGRVYWRCYFNAVTCF